MQMILRYQQQQDQESVNWTGLWSHIKLTGPHIFSGVDFWFFKASSDLIFISYSKHLFATTNMASVRISGNVSTPL